MGIRSHPPPWEPSEANDPFLINHPCCQIQQILVFLYLPRSLEATPRPKHPVLRLRFLALRLLPVPCPLVVPRLPFPCTFPGAHACSCSRPCLWAAGSRVCLLPGPWAPVASEGVPARLYPALPLGGCIGPLRALLSLHLDPATCLINCSQRNLSKTQDPPVAPRCLEDQARSLEVAHPPKLSRLTLAPFVLYRHSHLSARPCLRQSLHLLHLCLGHLSCPSTPPASLLPPNPLPRPSAWAPPPFAKPPARPLLGSSPQLGCFAQRSVKTRTRAVPSPGLFPLLAAQLPMAGAQKFYLHEEEVPGLHA